MWAYNKVPNRFKVGTYTTHAENGRNYVIVQATTLKGVTGATPTTVIYFDSATSEIKYASWREYVMYCLCWSRKLNLSALQRILDALRTANSILITAPTVASTAPTTHAVSGMRAAGGTITLTQAPTPEQIALIKQVVCGGCAGGDCDSCPIGNVVGCADSQVLYLRYLPHRGTGFFTFREETRCPASLSGGYSPGLCMGWSAAALPS
jgi:hypothetical protein